MSSQFETFLRYYRESVGETKYLQEDVDEGETKVDEVVGTFIKMRQSYYIDFQIGVVI